MTYGPLNVSTWGAENEKLSIGNYVSIATGVKFLLGGNHRYDNFSTYPFKVKIRGDASEALSKDQLLLEMMFGYVQIHLFYLGLQLGKER